MTTEMLAEFERALRRIVILEAKVRELEKLMAITIEEGGYNK